MTIEETHKDGVDRTVLILSTEGHEQDVKAMLELYDDLIERDEPQNDQKTTQSDNENSETTQSEPQNIKNDPQNSLKDKDDLQNGLQKLLDLIKKNPKITKSELSLQLQVSSSTIKRWLKLNHISWSGPSKSGHWEIKL